MSAGMAVVGAYLHNGQGAAYVFAQTGITWLQQQELTASDGASEDWFGTSVAVSGSTVVVGAPGHSVDSNTRQGAAYLFVQSGTTWSQQQELTASDGAFGDEFGDSVAVSGSTAVVGAMDHNTIQGAAYVSVPPAMLTPTSATYANQKVGTTSEAKKFYLTNEQTVALTDIVISTTGNFRVWTTTCTNSLEAHKTCNISVTFAPKKTGTNAGKLRVRDSASNSPQTASLTGTGD